MYVYVYTYAHTHVYTHTHTLHTYTLIHTLDKWSVHRWQNTRFLGTGIINCHASSRNQTPPPPPNRFLWSHKPLNNCTIFLALTPLVFVWLVLSCLVDALFFFLNQLYNNAPEEEPRMWGLSCDKLNSWFVIGQKILKLIDRVLDACMRQCVQSLILYPQISDLKKFNESQSSLAHIYFVWLYVFGTRVCAHVHSFCLCVSMKGPKTSIECLSSTVSPSFFLFCFVLK